MKFSISSKLSMYWTESVQLVLGVFFLILDRKASTLFYIKLSYVNQAQILYYKTFFMCP